MLIVQDAFHATDLPRGGVVAIGNFDGVHRGQRAVLERVTTRARELGLTAMVVTFDPHPMGVLHPEAAPPPLTVAEQKERLLAAAGIEVTLVVRFTPEFARTPAARFVGDFLAAKLDAREIYVGRGFVFGHRREGNLALLEAMGREAGFTAHGVDEVLHRGERISSTRIRRAVAEGRMGEAADLLGRPFALTGEIARGDRMGKKLGWPTINLVPDHELIPLDGVYAGRVHLPAFPAPFACATNIGTRPTVYENYQRVVESHILDFASDVYGARVELEFHQRLREERIFPSVMDLSAQIGRDVEATREYFAARQRLQGSADLNP